MAISLIGRITKLILKNAELFNIKSLLGMKNNVTFISRKIVNWPNCAPEKYSIAMLDLQGQLVIAVVTATTIFFCSYFCRR